MVQIRLRQQRLENFFERAASAENTGLHRANAAFQDFGDFFVAEAFEVEQNHGAAKHVRYLLQRALHGDLNFPRSQKLERSGAEIFDLDARVAFFWLGVNRNIFLEMTFEPALVIERFADGDAI